MRLVQTFLFHSACATALLAQQEVPICNAIGASPNSDGVCDGNAYYLVFSDEFDGNTLDLSKWEPITGVVRDLDNSIGWFKPENVVVSDGSLRLQSKHETTTGTVYYSWDPLITQVRTFDYSVGEVNSRQLFGYGYWEGAFRLPDNTGAAWPSFWLYGQQGSFQCEIDIFEYWNNLSCHWHMNTHVGDQQGTVYHCNTTNNGACRSPYDIFALRYDAYNTVWYRNGVWARNMPKWSNLLGQALNCDQIYGGEAYILNPIGRYPSMQVLKLILSDGLSHTEVLDDAAFPYEMSVDYIRYWQRLQCRGNAVMNTTASFEFQEQFNTYIGTTFNIGSAVWMGPPCNTQIVASDYIQFNPGVFIGGGANFLAKIDEVVCGGTPGMMPVDEDLAAHSAKSFRWEGDVQEPLEVSTLPSPFTTSFEVVITGGTPAINVLLDVVDLNGRIMFSKGSPVRSQIVDASTWSAGVYSIRVCQGEQIVYRRIVKVN